MMKLKRYLKPYIGFALAAIVLMFCQAAVDLNLPNLMSDIVNVGIQQGGITEAAPKAVSALSSCPTVRTYARYLAWGDEL